ncbi:MAG: TonB family protein [Elusimicrobiota bacterium]
MLNGTLKPYLAYSAISHAALLSAALFVIPGASSQSAPVYHIINLQASPGIINRSPGAAEKRGPAPKAASARPVKLPPPQRDPDVFDTAKRGPRKPLPRPSFLADAAPTPAPVEKEAPAEARPEPASLDGEGSLSAPGEPASLTAIDMPDFPYPWYVTQLRSAIWDRWTARMFSGTGACGVRFSVMRDGRTVDIRVEFTSGDKGFDYAALSAVQDAAPFPPLPPGFKDSFLNVHFEFKAN